MQFKEAVQINTGLLHLHRVIQCLVKKQPFVPYRDSLLTRVLQNSLSGNCQTLLLAHISPDLENQAESISTLRYASEAKLIQYFYIYHNLIIRTID